MGRHHAVDQAGGGDDVRELKRRVERTADHGAKPGGHYNTQHNHATGVSGVRAIKMRTSGIRLPYVQIGRNVYIIHALKKKRDAYTRADRGAISARYAEFQANKTRLQVVEP